MKHLEQQLLLQPAYQINYFRMLLKRLKEKNFTGFDGNSATWLAASISGVISRPMKSFSEG